MIGICPVRYETGDYLPGVRSPVGELITIIDGGYGAMAWVRAENGEFVKVRTRNMKFYDEKR